MKAIRLYVLSFTILSGYLGYSQGISDWEPKGKVHIYSGHFTGSSEFRNVYEKGRQLIGMDALVGIDKYFLIGKFQKFETQDESITKLVPDGGTAHWYQDFRFIGIRGYESDKKLRMYGELGYINSRVEEQLKVKNPLYSSLNTSAKKTYHGVGVGIGTELLIWIISVEAGFQYSHIPDSDNMGDDSSVNRGGLLFTIGIGVSL